MPRRRTNAALRHVVLAALLVATAHVAHALEPPYNITEVSKFSTDRYRSISTAEPVSKAMRASRLLRARVAPVFHLIDVLSDLTEARRAANHSETCNVHKENPWAKRSTKRPQILQVGELTDDCFTMVDVDVASREGDLPPRLAASARHSIAAAKDALFTASRSMPLPTDGNWSDPSAPYPIAVTRTKRKGQTCEMDAVSAYRKNGEWYLMSAMTNFPADRMIPDCQRHVVHEWVPRHYNHSLQLVHQKQYKNYFELSTTIVAMLKGPVSTSTAEVGDFDEPIGPVAGAYRKNLVIIDQAADSVTASNIAILALPMVMNLIPISFVAEVNAAGMVAYIIVTDVFSTIPFLIKGVELVRSSLPKRQNVISFFTGDADLAQIEIWAAECRGAVRFRVMGGIFIAVALVVLFAGLVLEVWAWRFMTRKKEEVDSEDGLYGPLGKIITLGYEHYGYDREYLRYADRFERDLAEHEALRLASPSANAQGNCAIEELSPSTSSSRRWFFSNWGAGGQAHGGSDGGDANPANWKSK